MKTDGRPGNSGNRVVFEEPKDLASAKAWRIALIDEISDISTQLSDKNKRDKCHACNGEGCRACHNQGGIRWPRVRWHAWRQSAITALRARENTLRKLNAWIVEQPENATHTSSPRAEADRLIEKAFALLSNLREDLDGDLDPEEMEVIESLGNYLRPTGT